MRVTLVGILQSVAVVTVLFSLVTALPLNDSMLQLFTHFRPQYFVVSVLLLLALAAFRQHAYTIALLVAVAVNASFVLPWYMGKAPDQGATTLRVVQANILSTNTEHEKIFRMLESEQPDLIVFQEVSPQWLTALAALKPEYPHSYAEAREGNFGIAVFSRIPLLSVSHVDSPPYAYPTIIAKLRVGDELVNLVATHPTIPVSPPFFEARNLHLDSVQEVLANLDGSTILLGDLNTAMWDVNYRTFEKRTGLRNARKGFGIVPTWPTFMPFAMIPIDHVLVSKDIGVQDVHAGARMGSDHLPLVVTLSL